MAESRRTTVYLDSDLHRALRLKAIETDSSISDLVNGAVRQTLIEDAEDLAAFEDRAAEATIPYGDFVMALKRDGKL
jgi:predicted transcriptional regulator